MTTTPNFAHEDAAYFMSEDGVTKRIARVALVDEDGVPAGVTAQFDGTKLDGAAFVTGTDKVMPSGYVQRATPTTHADGDVGAARMDSRQRLVAGVESPLTVYTATHQIRDTNYVTIDLAAYVAPLIRWAVYVWHAASGHDQAISVWLRLGSGSMFDIAATLPSGNYQKTGFAESVTGIPTASGTMVAVPLLGNWPGSVSCQLLLRAPVTAPSVGELNVSVIGR